MLKNALWEAIRGRHVGVVSALVKRMDHVDEANAEGVNALMLACQVGVLPIVKLLLGAGASPFASDREGRTALHWACIKGTTLIVDALLDAGADVNAQTRDGLTPLMCLIYRGHADATLRFLRHRGIDLALKDHEGRSAMDYAAGRSMPTVLNALLRRTQNVTDSMRTMGKDRYGYTPLHQACRNGDDQTLAVLLMTPGIDVYRASDAGETPLIVATKMGALGCVEKLLAVGARCNRVTNGGESALWEAARLNRLVIAEVLLKAGADVNHKVRNGLTPLLVAIRERNVDIVRLLLANGADVSVRDATGRGPLAYAATTNLEELTVLLLEAGAQE